MLSLQDPGTLSAEGKELEKATFLSLVTRLSLNSFLVTSTKSTKIGISQASPAHMPSSGEIFLVTFIAVATAAPVLRQAPVKVCGETGFQPCLTLVREGGGSSSPSRPCTVP